MRRQPAAQPVRRIAALCVLLGAPTSLAHADSVVNLCAFDNQAKKAPSDMSLAEAIVRGGRITFSCGRTTIRFRQSHMVTKSTEIDGARVITLDGGAFRMFTATDARITFRLVDLDIVNGGKPPVRATPPFISFFLPGGVVRGTMRLEIVRSSVTRSKWAVDMKGGSMHIEASRFADNDGPVLVGGNIEVLNHSVFSNNRGNPIFGREGANVIADSDFFGNLVASGFVRSTLRVTRSRFSANSATGNAAALNIAVDATIEESEFRNNAATNGGAININGAARNVSLRAVKFYDNTAKAHGGAIGVEPSVTPLDLTLRHATFVGNRAQWGGAISLERSIGNTRALRGVAVGFNGNQASVSGGALYAPNSSVRMARAVFVRNSAGAAGGAIAALQQGPRSVELGNSLFVHNVAVSGSAFWGNSATFINSTITDNGEAPVWAEARALTPFPPPAGTPPTFPIRFQNSIVSGDNGRACGPAVASTPYVDDGNNLQYPGGSCGASIASSWPALGPYYMPLTWSAAIDGGNNKACAIIPVERKDVYNTHRPLSSHCTIGAVEGSVSHLIARWRNRNDTQGKLLVAGR